MSAADHAATESPRAQPLRLTGHSLTLDDLIDVARHRRPVEPLREDDSETITRMRESADWIESCVAEVASAEAGGPAPRALYGINTGFGSLAGKQAFATVAELNELSRRLIVSDAAGVGPYLDEEIVRAAMLIRVSSLIQGYSGVGMNLVNTLIEMLNRGVYPAVPEMGSLGASGDLIPLAHLMLVMSRPPGDDDPEEDSGEAFISVPASDDDPAGPAYRKVSGKEAMALAGIPRIVLGAKEGLAAINGTTFCTALTALAVVDAENLVRTAEISLSMSLEAVIGYRDAFLPQIHEARRQRGQIDSAANIYNLVTGSKLLDGDVDRDPLRQPPQDAYSFRCAPQVFGVVRDTLAFARDIVETELNAATDNPLVFPGLPSSRALKAVSGGNFHAEYLACVADFMTIVVTELANITERRIFRLTDRSMSRGLPDMLIDSASVGLDCGYMMPQYLAAALVSRSKTLAHPDSVDSIPTSANQEDHVSMGMNAALHLRQVMKYAETVVGIELLMAAQALDLRLSGVRVDHVLAELSLEHPIDSSSLSLTVANQADGRCQGIEGSTVTQGVRLVGLRTESPARTIDDLGTGSRTALSLIRSQRTADGRPIATIERDVVLYPYLRSMVELVHSGMVVAAVRDAGIAIR